MSPAAYLPRTRREGILSRTLGDETVVYDSEHHEAHCLNAAAAVVWQRADGTRDIGELARELAGRLDLPCDEDLVWLALEELEKAKLIAAPPVEPERRPSRREILKKLGRGTALALLAPAISSVFVPTAQAAGTCLGAGENCASGVECCSGICFAGVCA